MTGQRAMASSGGLLPGRGYCAEGNVVRLLGGDPTHVVFTRAVTVDRAKSTGERFVVHKPVCTQCQVDFPSDRQFIVGIKHSPTPLEGQTHAPWNMKRFE